jgi:putative FmdB family regulatory protein
MPTYDYRCEKGHTFELFHSIKDETPKVCPTCGSASKRVPGGGGGLLFRGSGFYITENRSSGYKEKAKAEKSGGATPAGGESKSSGGSGGAGGGAKPSGTSGSSGSGPKRSGGE